jgi:putative copper resistance protein D
MLTGVVNTMIVLGHLPLNWSQVYERLLLSKILLVFAMISMAMLNRYIFAPRAKAFFGFSAKALVIAMASEFAGGIVTILSANVLGQLDPI